MTRLRVTFVMKKPKVDQDLCIGCGLCETIYPEVFKLNKNFKAEVIGEGKDEKKCREAIGSCPVGAISYGQISGG